METNIGPKFNSITTRFSSRDSLGIESVAASISGELCPIINTVTPRAFYWPFMCWIYYDFYKYSGIIDRNNNAFDKLFLKRQDYFFVLANLLAESPDQNNLVGKQKTQKDIDANPEGPYSYNDNYFIPSYGGMQYYNAGCLTMKFITAHNEETDERYTFPRITQYGEEMALAFEKVICGTSYYREYRLRNVPVPREVLLEYASVISLDMKHFERCKELLRKHLFEYNSQLNACAQYALLVHSITKSHALSLPTARHILFDYYSPHGNNNSCPENLLDTIRGWEIVIGRQYFCAGIEMILKYMLKWLEQPMDLECWINKTINVASKQLSIEDELGTILPKCYFTFEEREKMVADARLSSFGDKTVSEGLLLALSIYNRFKDRTDLENAALFLDYGKGSISGTGSISINEWFELIDQFKGKKIRTFLDHVIRECIVEQHKRTCFEKITRSSQSVDGFYFEYIDGIYSKNEHEFQVDFQGIRFVELMQVMKDLDMFEENK